MSKNLEVVALRAMLIGRDRYKVEYVYQGEAVAPPEPGEWRDFVPSRLITDRATLLDTKELAASKDLPITYYRR
jgi:hypothetical protein